MVVNFRSAPPANWLISQLRDRVVAGDSVATATAAAALGAIIADSQEVIDFIQAEMNDLQNADSNPQADTLEGGIVRGVIATCSPDED